MWVKLARAAATFNRLSARDIECYGLTGPQFAALEALGHLGAIHLPQECRDLICFGHIFQICDVYDTSLAGVQMLPRENHYHMIDVDNRPSYLKTTQ
jgi:hypothetical protein